MDRRISPVLIGLTAVASLLLTAAGPGCRGAESDGEQAPADQPSAQPAGDPSADRVAAGSPPAYQRIREPAVAGLFYPKNPPALYRAIEQYLADAKPARLEDLRALICPHAGYEYSGLTAAYGYKALAGRGFRTVVVMAPSHTVAFDGISVADADAYRTPLGLAPISEKSARLAKLKPFVLEPRCAMRRPDWAAQSSRQPPPPGQDTPETWEHSGEVQVPFLQKVLKDFSLVSLVFGETDPAEAAKALTEILDDRTLLVASSDLSHYLPYDAAKELDGRCLAAILELDVEKMNRQDACGKGPILTLMHVARQKGWKARLLDYRNSGDTSGNKDRVVGYAAVAFYDPARLIPATLSDAERKTLLELARRTVTQVVTTGGSKLPEVDDAALPAKFKEKKGCFVTLTKAGDLRGCIGQIMPQEPLYLAVMHSARDAAIADPRFPRVAADELAKLHVEISVLSVPAPLKYDSPEDLLDKLVPHRDGVVLKLHAAPPATFLPQVWEQIPDKETFLARLSQKAGRHPTAWRAPGTEVLIYHVESFEEAEK